MPLTIMQGLVAVTAGIDESNGNGSYVLGPYSLQHTANATWAYLRRRFGREYLGVMITDGKTTPVKAISNLWGSRGGWPN